MLRVIRGRYYYHLIYELITVLITIIISAPIPWKGLSWD